MRLAICILLLAAHAYAEPVVLAVDGKDIYVDLGAKDGVGAGTQLELLHEIVARDPKTGATLRDRFALGTIEVEDQLAQGGQGSIADRRAEHLGRTDAGIVMLRRIFARELDALKHGRPTRQWTMAPLIPADGWYV